MPISAQCPDCSAPIRALDSAAGKRVKCPKCGSVMILPAAEVEVVDDDFEVVDDEPTPKKKKPRPRDEDEDEEEERPKKKSSRRVAATDDEDDDRPRKKSSRRDDDDEDERPRRKSRGKKAAKSSNLPLILGGAGLVALLGIGVFVWQLTKASSTGNAPAAGGGGKAAPAKPALPAGWITFEEPGGRFSAAVPSQPEAIDVSAMLDPTAAEMKMWQCQTAGKKVHKILLQIDKQTPPAGEAPTSILNRMCDNYSQVLGPAFGRETKRGDGTVGGVKAGEMSFARGSVKTVVRVCIANQKRFVVMVQADGSDPLDDPDTHTFFSNIRAK